MNSAEAKASAALRRIARDESIKAYVQDNAPLYRALLRAAKRFIGGEILTECLDEALALNRRGHAATIDYMGESTRDEAMAWEAAEEFLAVIQAVEARRVHSSVSLDLSHIGLAVDAELAFDNASALTGAARDAGLEIMISMEGSERTDVVLETHRRLCESFDNVGITLQAYLYRTSGDLDAALGRPGRIRLVKGAYGEPAEVALPRGPETDAAYVGLMETLLTSGHACSISTHDPALLDRARGGIQTKNLGHEPVEFEMLHGVEPERLRKMSDSGYQTRVYLPYGREWYLYLCHRLAEHPPNIYQAIFDAIGAPEERT